MKILVATEKEPSFTARLTPNQIGELLTKCSKEQLYAAIGAATFNVGAYGTDKQQQDLAEVLLSTGNSFKSNLECGSSLPPIDEEKLMPEDGEEISLATKSHPENIWDGFYIEESNKFHATGLGAFDPSEISEWWPLPKAGTGNKP